jgi:hypothetical protein
LFVSVLSKAQIASIVPNNAKRGDALITTITPVGAWMTISSGNGSMYHFSLEQGNYVIPESNYTFHSSGLGFASSVDVMFVIPYNALGGLYDIHVKNFFWPFDQITVDAFEIFETGISGKVYFDGNQNGICDSNDQPMRVQRLQFYPLSIGIYTSSEGKYGAYLNPGTFKDSLIVPPNFYVTTPNTSYIVTVPPDTGNLDFGLYTPPDSVFQHKFEGSADRIRCINASNAFWEVESNSNNYQFGKISLIKESTITFISSIPPPDTIVGDTIIWTYSLLPFQSRTTELLMQGHPGVVLSSMIFIDSLFDSQGTFISQTTDTLIRPVACSMDPNEKFVSPSGIDSINHYTLKTDELEYTIFFQNCGTDTAMNITIRDTIDSSLDMSTFHILHSSAPVYTQIEANNRIRFTFNNILLPDSGTDELKSHGQISYAIRPLAGVADFTLVRNAASIYFDLNDAVRTGTTFNTLVSFLNVGVEEYMQESCTLYPNPVNTISTILLPDLSDYLFSVYSLTGEKIFNDVVKGSCTIYAEKLKSGIYCYQLINNSTGKKFSGTFLITK